MPLQMDVPSIYSTVHESGLLLGLLFTCARRRASMASSRTSTRPTSVVLPEAAALPRSLMPCGLQLRLQARDALLQGAHPRKDRHRQPRVCAAPLHNAWHVLAGGQLHDTAAEQGEKRQVGASQGAPGAAPRSPPW